MIKKADGCETGAAKLESRALQFRKEQLDARERALVENELKVQQAFDGVLSDRLAAAAHWGTVQDAFEAHRETVLREDMASMQAQWQQHTATARLSKQEPVRELSVEAPLEADAAVGTHACAAADGAGELAAEERDSAAELRDATATINEQQARVAHLESLVCARQHADSEKRVSSKPLDTQWQHERDAPTGPLSSTYRPLPPLLPRVGRAPPPPRSSAAVSEKQEWNRLRDENFKPLPHRRSGLPAPATHSQFVEQVITHMRLETGESGYNRGATTSGGRW
jgi:hypothetical protein